MNKNLFGKTQPGPDLAVTFFLKVRFKNARFAAGEMKPE